MCYVPVPRATHQKIQRLARLGFRAEAACHTRLSEVQIGQVGLIASKRVDEEGESLFELVLGHLHLLEVAVGRESNSCPLGPDGFRHRVDDFTSKATTVLDGASVAVRSAITGVLRELVDQIAVGAVDCPTKFSSARARSAVVLCSLSTPSPPAPSTKFLAACA